MLLLIAMTGCTPLNTGPPQPTPRMDVFGTSVHNNGIINIHFKSSVPCVRSNQPFTMTITLTNTSQQNIEQLLAEPSVDVEIGGYLWSETVEQEVVPYSLHLPAGASIHYDMPFTLHNVEGWEFQSLTAAPILRFQHPEQRENVIRDDGPALEIYRCES